MFKWFKKRCNAPRSAQPDLPLAPGRTVYAVGDIHGRVDLLEKILTLIDTDIAVTEPQEPVLVFLGDYVDRGEESAQTLVRMAALWTKPHIEIHFLKGNHEAMMLDFLDNPDTGASWLKFGGLQTLHSFGVGGVTENANAQTLMQARDALEKALGDCKNFLTTGLKTHMRFGNIFLCHAAVDSSMSLDAQPEDILLWGQPSFTKRGGPPDAWVVHGHTITLEPDIGRHRIGLDTGAYYSGNLTALRIDDGKMRFFSTI